MSFVNEAWWWNLLVWHKDHKECNHPWGLFGEQLWRSCESTIGPGSKPYVALVCFRSFLCSKKFFSVRFSPLLKRKQHLKTPIRPRMVEEESLSGSATSKSLFIFYSFYFISIFLFLLGIAILYYSTLKLTLPHNQISCDSFAGQKQKIEKRTDSWKAKWTRTAGASSATSAVKSRFFHHSCIISGRTGNDSSEWEERAGKNHVASWKRQGNWGELTFAKTSGTHVTGNTGEKIANS